MWGLWFMIMVMAMMILAIMVRKMMAMITISPQSLGGVNVHWKIPHWWPLQQHHPLTTIFQKLSFIKADCCVLCFCILAEIRFEESAFKYCVLFSIETEGSAVLEWINCDNSSQLIDWSWWRMPEEMAGVVILEVALLCRKPLLLPMNIPPALWILIGQRQTLSWWLEICAQVANINAITNREHPRSNVSLMIDDFYVAY